MGWAARHPDRVKRIVLLNTGAFRNPKAQSLPPSLWLVRNTPLGSLLVRGFNAFSAGATRMAVVNSMEPRVRAGYVAPYDSWKNRIATLRFVQDIPLNAGDDAFEMILETERGLEQFRTPTMIFWGEQDFVFDAAFLEEWQRRWPHADVHRYPDAGHYVLEDAGGDIIPRIQSFLA